MEVEDVIKEYVAIDAVAEDIISDRHQIVNFDGKRNKNREALRRLRRQQQGSQGKSWVCFGNTFIKMDDDACMKMLEKDQKTLDEEVESLRAGLKPKVAQLHLMEGRAEVKGFQLRGMRVEELLGSTEQ